MESRLESGGITRAQIPDSRFRIPDKPAFHRFGQAGFFQDEGISQTVRENYIWNLESEIWNRFFKPLA